MRGQTKKNLKIAALALLIIIAIFVAINLKVIFFTLNLVSPFPAFKQTQSWQNRITRESVKFITDGHFINGYITKPNDNKKHPAILLYVPLARLQSGDTFLNVAMDSFAQAGFVVLSPFMEDRRFGVIEPSDIQVVRDSFLFLSNRPEVIKNRLGIIGVSFGAGPAILADSTEPLRSNTKFLITVGGYYDLKEAAKFVTTGYYEYSKIKKQSKNIDDYARLIFSRSVIELLSDEQAKQKLNSIFLKSFRRENYTQDLANLTPEEITVWNFLTNRDKNKFDFYYEQLPFEVKQKVENLNVGNYLDNIKAEIMFIHSTDDIAIPYTETLKLYDNFPNKKKARLLLSNVFVHASLVDLNFSNFVKIYIPNAYRFLSAIKWTLGQ